VSQLSDGKLVRQLQLGDLGALGVLYDRHRQLVFRTALGITGDPEAAADLLQDVFLRMHRFSHRIDTDSRIALIPTAHYSPGSTVQPQI